MANVRGKEGSIVDASFVEAPRQRNSREENKQIKEGTVPGEWKENQSKLSQKDTDATWTKKNNEVHYGYKNHVKADKKPKPDNSPIHFRIILNVLPVTTLASH